MRRLLMIGFLFCSGTSVAQNDERRVRTVDIDGGQVRSRAADDRWVTAPERAVLTDQHRARVRGPERDTQPDDYPDDAGGPEHAVQSEQPRARVRGPERDTEPDDYPDDAGEPEHAVQPEQPRARVRGAERVTQAVDHWDDAEQADDNLALARRLVALLPDSSSRQASADACIPDAKTMRADILTAYRANPRAFQGISPRSAYWPDVERIWRNYYVERCAAHSDESPAETTARMYAANLSTDELRETLAFQQSRAGRAFLNATRLARQDGAHAAAEPAAQRHTDEALDRFRQAMLRLKVKFDRAPR